MKTSSNKKRNFDYRNKCCARFGSYNCSIFDICFRSNSWIWSAYRYGATLDDGEFPIHFENHSRQRKGKEE